MNISITYCNEWNYLPTAASLAEAIKDEFDVEAKLLAGGGGIFDVHVDKKLIFSKHAAGRFPEHHEVLDQLAKRGS